MLSSAAKLQPHTKAAFSDGEAAGRSGAQQLRLHSAASAQLVPRQCRLHAQEQYFSHFSHTHQVTSQHPPHCLPFFNFPPSFCRNNLTMLETVTVVGAGQTGDVTFDNKATDSTLLFEVTDKNCESECDSPEHCSSRTLLKTPSHSSQNASRSNQHRPTSR